MLPWGVRYRIYELLGAVSPYPIKLSTLSLRENRDIPVELMRVCRSFYDDLNRVIYSSNAFSLSLDDHEVNQGRMFLALSPGSISLMKDLYIHFG